MRVVHSSDATEIGSWVSAARMLHFNSADFNGHHADVHVCALSAAGDVSARCSIWWTHVPDHEKYRVGVIGHYAAANDESAAAVLSAAQDHLREVGCDIAIGPMNGNTWRSYRFVAERGEQPAFFLEPTNPQEWPLQFETAGFSPLASYFSALNSDLARPDPRLVEMERRVAESGISIRSAKPNVRDELQNIYAVSKVSFRRNFLYTEISESNFISMYEPLLPVVRPELVLIAEKADRCLGYLFAIPDLAMKTRELDVDTFIIKTVSILPEPQLRGLGSLLVARAQQIGCRLGFRRCIHALMFEDNISMNISRHYATVMRKYMLYSKSLAK